MTIDLAAIKARAEAATEGPWHAEPVGDFSDEGRDWTICDIARWNGYTNAVGFGTDEATARFVAAARQDVPDLVAEVERLGAALEQVRHIASYHSQDEQISAIFDVAHGALSGSNQVVTEQAAELQHLRSVLAEVRQQVYEEYSMDYAREIDRMTQNRP